MQVFSDKYGTKVELRCMTNHLGQRHMGGYEPNPLFPIALHTEVAEDQARQVLLALQEDYTPFKQGSR